MGFMKNLFIGGARPSVEGDEVRCGECREVMQPDAKRCPYCGSDVFTLKGRVLSRFPGLIGLGLLAGGVETPGLVGAALVPFGVLFLLVAVYYFWQAPIYSVTPPHQPPRNRS